MMDPNIDDYDFSKNYPNIEDPVRVTKADQGKRSNKCNQCDSKFSHKSSLKAHIKTHSGDKSNRCNQCNFASVHAHSLRLHLKTHSGEK